MQIKLGEKIKELRRRDGRTQESLAGALGVTAQAVSRWENCEGYPDMESIPAIANYFGISIDSLFGYECGKDKRVADIIARVDAYGIKARGDDEWGDECIAILREGLLEFPQNEQLMITLADTLSEAGWRRHHEWLSYDEEGYKCHDYDRHCENPYWRESVKLCEVLADSAGDPEIVTRAIGILVLLYRNLGRSDKAVEYANRMPKLSKSRELLLAAACDGKDEARYIGEALLKLADQFAQQLVYGLVNYRGYFDSDLPIEKIKGAISVFELICDDGNFGRYNGCLIELYLYLSRVQWERGYHDDAFVSLDRAYDCARSLEALLDGAEHYYTAPLVKHVSFTTEVGFSGKAISAALPEDWPFWTNPDYSEVEREIKADPRWKIWTEKCRK